MKRLMLLLVMVCFLSGVDAQETSEYIGKIAPYPAFNTFNSIDRTQITYTNGDPNNPEYFIITCDKAKQEMNVFYYITREGFQVTNADFFTIQRYPQGWLKLTPPYHAPSVVIYNAGMAGGGEQLITALRSLYNDGDWGIVITFETYVNEHDIITETWSDIIPSRIFRRDLKNSNLSICEATKFNALLPLVTFTHEDQ
jgi:hypothetical protein